MLIVLEGTDGTGKSSLADRLAEGLDGSGYHNVDVWHRSAPTTHPLNDYVPGEGRHLILDRWHWGERVWPKIFDRKSDYDHEMFFHTEMLLQALGALVIRCTDDPEAIILRLKERGEAALREDQVQTAEGLYDFVERTSLIKPMHYRITDEQVPPFVIIRRAQNLERNAIVRHGRLGILGGRDAWLLLVGERVGPNPKWPTMIPFVPYPNTSGHFLLEGLNATNSLTKIMLTNAFIDNTPKELFPLADHRMVVALGQAAHEELTRQGITHGTVPHPQYVRRFKYNQQKTYARMIWSAAYDQRDLTRFEDE
jgi:hypothetical protein